MVDEISERIRFIEWKYIASFKEFIDETKL
jgi:hypothetical protein